MGRFIEIRGSKADKWSTGDVVQKIVDIECLGFSKKHGRLLEWQVDDFANRYIWFRVRLNMRFIIIICNFRKFLSPACCKEVFPQSSSSGAKYHFKRQKRHEIDELKWKRGDRLQYKYQIRCVEISHKHGQLLRWRDSVKGTYHYTPMCCKVYITNIYHNIIKHITNHITTS